MNELHIPPCYHPLGYQTLRLTGSEVSSTGVSLEGLWHLPDCACVRMHLLSVRIHSGHVCRWVWCTHCSWLRVRVHTFSHARQELLWSLSVFSVEVLQQRENGRQFCNSSGKKWFMNIMAKSMLRDWTICYHHTQATQDRYMEASGDLRDLHDDRMHYERKKVLSSCGSRWNSRRLQSDGSLALRTIVQTPEGMLRMKRCTRMWKDKHYSSVSNATQLLGLLRLPWD